MTNDNNESNNEISISHHTASMVNRIKGMDNAKNP